MLQELPPPIIWECIVKDEKKKPVEECPIPVEEVQPNAAPDSGGGDNTGNPPKPGGK